MNIERFDELYYECKMREYAGTNAQLMCLAPGEFFESLEKLREQYIDSILEKDYIGATIVFSNSYSTAREYFCAKCFEEKLIPRKDFSELLADVYISANTGSGFRRLMNDKDIVRMFKYCEPQYLMNDEDYTYYQNLPDIITVYRGIICETLKRPFGISWTLTKKVGDFFARKYPGISTNGRLTKYMIIGQIEKSNIFAYFNSRKEQEIVLNPHELLNEHILTFS